MKYTTFFLIHIIKLTQILLIALFLLFGEISGSLIKLFVFEIFQIL